MLQGVPVMINAEGLRDYEYDYQRPAGVTRILALGDSVTFGWGVKLEDTYPKVLERLLNGGESRDRYEVLNCGVGNYTPRASSASTTGNSTSTSRRWCCSRST